MENKLLLEKWAPVLDTETERTKKVSKNREKIAQLLENQEAYIAENNTADIVGYTPILIPAVRRIIPNLLAFDICSVQPLSQPTGYAYALRFGYKGTGGSAVTTGIYNSDRDNTTNALFKTMAIFYSGQSTTFAIGDSVIVSGATDVSGTITYIDDTNDVMLVGYTASAKSHLPSAGQTLVVKDSASASVVVATDNEIAYQTIIPNYVQKVATATGEALSLATDMKKVGMNIERMSVEAQTRKLGAEFTIELAQDLKNIHGLDAENELINICEYEINAEIDRELLNVINSNATSVGTWTYASAQSAALDGRWEMEKYRTFYSRLLREANKIALSTRRGVANFMIASTNVVSILETLNGWSYANVPGDVEMKLGVSKVGTLDGKLSVYCDNFATSDYATLGYKGTSAFDSGVIYCPYVPLMLQKVVDPNTFQPKIGFMTRYNYVHNIFGTQNYYRKIAVSLAAYEL